MLADFLACLLALVAFGGLLNIVIFSMLQASAYTQQASGTLPAPVAGQLSAASAPYGQSGALGHVPQGVPLAQVVQQAPGVPGAPPHGLPYAQISDDAA